MVWALVLLKLGGGVKPADAFLLKNKYIVHNLPDEELSKDTHKLVGV